MIKSNSLLLAHSVIHTDKTYTKVGTSTKQIKQTIFTRTHNIVVRRNEIVTLNINNYLNVNSFPIVKFTTSEIMLPIPAY